MGSGMTYIPGLLIPSLKGFVFWQMEKIAQRNDTRAPKTFAWIYHMSFPFIFSLAKGNWNWDVQSSYGEMQHSDSSEMLSIFNINKKLMSILQRQNT